MGGKDVEGGMPKPLKDFTIKELVNKALCGFPEQEPDTYASTPALRDALKTSLDFKVSEQQVELNNKLNNLTKWLVALTIILVILASLQIRLLLCNP